LEQTLFHQDVSMNVDRWQHSNKAYLFYIHNSILLALENTACALPPTSYILSHWNIWMPLQLSSCLTKIITQCGIIFKYITYLQTYVLFPFNKQSFYRSPASLAVNHQFPNCTHLNFWYYTHTHTLSRHSFVENMHRCGELPASCAILRSNEFHNLVVYHTIQFGRKEIVFKRHFMPPTGMKMKTVSSLMIPFCQTTWCYIQQGNRWSSCVFLPHQNSNEVQENYVLRPEPHAHSSSPGTPFGTAAC
jgi:hypothetical protein